METLVLIETSAPAAWLRGGRWSYALVNALHIVGIATLFGAILPLDLRLLGLWRSVPLEPLARLLAPVSAAGLALAAGTGAALFATRAAEYAANPAFLAKLGLVALGALNALALRRSRAWRRGALVSPRVAAAAALSLALWLAAILAGRAIAFL